MAKQVLFVVAEIPDAGLANEILHLIRGGREEKRPVRKVISR